MIYEKLFVIVKIYIITSIYIKNYYDLTIFRNIVVRIKIYYIGLINI